MTDRGSRACGGRDNTGAGARAPQSRKDSARRSLPSRCATWAYAVTCAFRSLRSRCATWAYAVTCAHLAACAVHGTSA
eukprot:9989344-Alexandrium_andersonii.AAC.1